nr:hypothetical protein [Streptomyces piniterrae]
MGEQQRQHGQGLDQQSDHKDVPRATSVGEMPHRDAGDQTDHSRDTEAEADLSDGQMDHLMGVQRHRCQEGRGAELVDEAGESQLPLGAGLQQ